MKKVLIAGDIDGSFDNLLSKIESFAEKQQKFDFCLCVGKTLSLSFDPTQLQKENRKILLPIYFIDTSDLAPVLHTLYPDGHEIIPNLFFLGKAGIKRIQDISVAYLSGTRKEWKKEFENMTETYNSGQYTPADLENILNKREAEFKQGVDILLTSEWPEGFDSNLQEKISGQIANKSQDITRLVANLKPRYHFVGLENNFYKRPPYTNEDQPYITRLIGMGKIPKGNNPTTQQYIFALQLKSIETMTLEDLSVKTTDTTANPYTSKGVSSSKSKREEGPTDADLQKRSATAEQESAELKENAALYFNGFDKKTNDSDIFEFLSRWGQVQDYQLLLDEKSKHKGCGFVLFRNIKTTAQALKESGKYTMHGKAINFSKANKGVVEGGKLSQQNAECWFCLDNPNVAKELIVFIGDEFYIAMDKGPINSHHVLMIPIDHHPNSIELPLKGKDELDILKLKIADRYEDAFDELVIFYEKYLRVTQNIAHMIVNAIPYKKKSFEFFIAELDKKVKRLGYSTFILKPDEKPKDLVREGEYYVYIEAVNPSELRLKEKYAKRYLIIIEGKQVRNFPRDLGRELYCDIMECRNKISWKDCVLSDKEVNERNIELKRVLN